MRSFVFLLMLAVCLVAWECAATTGEEGISDHNTEQKDDAGSVNTTTAADQPQPKPQSQPRSELVEGSEGSERQPALPKAPEGPKPGAEAPEDHEDLEDPDDLENNKDPAVDKPNDAPPTSLMTAHSQPGHSSAAPQQQQQQQPQVPQQITSHGSEPKERVTGSVSHNQHNAPPTRTGEDELHTAVVDTQTRTPDAHSGQPEHSVPKPRPEGQHSPSSHSTAEVVTNIEDTQPKKGQKTDNAPSGISPPQGPPPTPPTIKSKTPENDITTSVVGAAPPKKPTPNSTPATDNTVHQTDTTTGDKEQNPMQTSVSSTSEPVKGESTPHANTKENLSKALQSLDNKDSSIGTSFVCALAALATLVLVALTSPS